MNHYINSCSIITSPALAMADMTCDIPSLRKSHGVVPKLDRYGHLGSLGQLIFRLPASTSGLVQKIHVIFF